jgi:hypothetical protein
MNKDMRFAVVLTKQGLEELKENLGNFLIDQPLLRCSKVDLDQPYLSMKAFNDKTKQFCRLHIPHHFVQFVAEQVAGKTLVGFDSRSAKKSQETCSQDSGAWDRKQTLSDPVVSTEPNHCCLGDPGVAFRRDLFLHQTPFHVV